MDPEYQDEDVKIPRVKARVAGFRIVEEKHRYATYRIQVRTKDLPEPHNRWEVFHRYSEFANFHNKVSMASCSCKYCTLPHVALHADQEAVSARFRAAGTTKEDVSDVIE